MKHPNPPTASIMNQEKKIRHLPDVLLGLFVVYLVVSFQPPKPTSLMNLNAFGGLPVLNGGRTKPLDTVARNSLLILSGKQSIRTESGTRSAIEWLTDVLFNPGRAATYPVFTIDDPDVLGAMGITQTNQRRYSFADLEPHGSEIERQATQANQVKPELRSRFQTAAFNLEENFTLYQKLQNTLQVAGSEHQVQALQAFEQKLNAAAQAHLSTAAESAPTGKKRMGRAARAEAQKPEFSEAARALAAKY